ncbi:MAG: hypothetical protein R2849_17525 [Thermomicrobiales bacterium]
MSTLFHSISTRRSGSRTIQIAVLVATISVVLTLIALQSARAVAPSNQYFQRTWARTDKPIVDGLVSRAGTWSRKAYSMN